MKKILIIGATGMLGKPVTHELVQAGFDITILARNPRKAEQEFSGCTIVQGDLKDPDSLEAACAGKDAVYLSLHVPQDAVPEDWHAEREGLEHLITAARKTEIGCIAYLSSLVKDYQGQDGFSWWMFDIKHEAVRTIRDSGIPYLIFCPSNFMENLLHGFKRGSRLTSVGSSDVKKYWIAASDYGKQVARALDQFTGSREYVIQGPQGYSDREAIDVFIRHYKAESLSKGNVPMGVLKFMGLFSRKMKYGARIIEALNKYPEEFRAGQAWEDLGRPAVTIEEFAGRS